MDFIKEIGDSRLYTFHSHTEFCDGRATMEAFAREALRQGFSHYGFSPHSPIPIPSPCNILQANVPRYLAEATRIKDTYGDRVCFYTAMEIDYLGDQWGPAHPYFDTLPLDYRIGSVHFIRSQDGEYIDIDGHFDSFMLKMARNFHDDIRYVVETFYSQSIKMLEAGSFDIIGHFDKIGHNASHYSPGIESEDWYGALVDDLIDHIIDSHVTVELNTKAWKDHRRMFPSPDYLPRLIAAHVPVIVNSDAHVPALINASRPEAFDLLDRLQLRPGQHIM